MDGLISCSPRTKPSNSNLMVVLVLTAFCAIVPWLGWSSSGFARLLRPEETFVDLVLLIAWSRSDMISSATQKDDCAEQSDLQSGLFRVVFVVSCRCRALPSSGVPSWAKHFQGTFGFDATHLRLPWSLLLLRRRRARLLVVCETVQLCFLEQEDLGGQRL